MQVREPGRWTCLWSMMRNWFGVELVTEARKLRSGLPALLVTGFANMVESQDQGLHCVGKPFKQADLARSVAEPVSESGPDSR